MLDKDKEERRLKKVKIALMRNPQFALWSGILMVGKTGIKDDVPTAYTNGRDEYYGREFVKKLDDKELAFVVLHENLHKAFRHLFIWKKLHDVNHKLANMACDYVINLMLLEMDRGERYLSMPRHEGKAIGLVDERFKGMNAKQVFDILKDEKGEDYGKGDISIDMSGDGDGDGGFDDHDWDGAKELTDEQKKAVEREIDQALRQGQIAHTKLHGKGAGGLGRELTEILEPKVDWREVLREFVTSVCSNKDASSWRRVNRRYLSNDVYMPSLIGESVGHLVIGVDTSGSIGQREINEFLSEIKGIAELVNPNKVDLLYWDTEVAGHEEYGSSTVSNIVSSTKPAGGGGTDPTCVMHYMKEKNIDPECVIMLTDGYIGDWGNEWTKPILWAICGGNDAYAPVGKTIHVKD